MKAFQSPRGANCDRLTVPPKPTRANFGLRYGVG